MHDGTPELLPYEGEVPGAQRAIIPHPHPPKYTRNNKKQTIILKNNNITTQFYLPILFSDVPLRGHRRITMSWRHNKL